MEIKSVIIHEIQKDEDIVGQAKLLLTDSLLDINNQALCDMLNSLDRSFSKKTINRAKFSEDGFKRTIQNFNNIDMVKYSRQLTQRLKDIIDSVTKAKGGYLLFSEYRTTHDFLAIFLLRNAKGSKLTHTQNNWDLDVVSYLNVENFAMGAKINLTILNKNLDERYISLVKGNTEVSRYFESWIGLAHSQQESKDAEMLLKIANNIPLPNGMTRDNLKKHIFDFVEKQPNRFVNLRTMSAYIFEDENHIPDYCEQHNFDIDGEFKMKKGDLDKFCKISVKTNDIVLEFMREDFRSDVISITQDGNQIIIYSKELADQIKDKLKIN